MVTLSHSKLQEVTSELNSLHEALRLRPDSQTLQVPSDAADSRTISPDPLPGLSKQPSSSVSHREAGVRFSTFFGIENPAACALQLEDQCLGMRLSNSDTIRRPIDDLQGDTTVTGVAAVELFDQYGLSSLSHQSNLKVLYSFHRNYYVHCPELDTSVPLTDLTTQSQLLFWTIIVISSRYHSDHDTMYQPLIQPYEQLLSTYLVRPMHALSIIQAILLLCHWPLPVPLQPQDPTWNILGMITNAAVNIGLHRPGCEREYGFPNVTQREVGLRTRTWLRIFHFTTM